jgi:hypothetical protein
MWILFDTQTKSLSKRTYATYSKANAAAERLNQKYGAVRYSPYYKD